MMARCVEINLPVASSIWLTSRVYVEQEHRFFKEPNLALLISIHKVLHVLRLWQENDGKVCRN